eukprot:TRINITY_DN268_c0_g1_i2.p1 TRINITY_DN268_c0_g1~~TRINITY_DN268_c0_g1_i2.p1  ORF type:complete len:236 (-),score=78.76 TRINITY_DN268_c0_g1_i2:335-1042(-)
MLPDLLGRAITQLQAVLTNQFADLLQGGISAFGGVTQLRLCSEPTLLTGDVERVVAELIKEENDTLHRDITIDSLDGRDLKLVAAASGGDDFCCPPVVDSSTWLTLVGGMAIVTYFLRLQITMDLGRKRRRRREDDIDSFLLGGLEEFEETVVEEDEEIGRQSWLLSIINEIANVKQSVDNESKNQQTNSDDDRHGWKNSEDEASDRCRVKVWRCMSGVMEEAVKYVDKSHGLWR